MEEQKFDIRKYDDTIIKTRRGFCDRAVWKEDMIRNHYGIDKNYGVCIDLGAHIGSTAVLMAKYGNKVYAYEPEQGSYDLLVENIALNKMEDLIISFKLAVGEHGKAKIYRHNNNSGANSIFMSEDNRIGEEEIEVISLTEVFKNNDIEHCGLLKIDVEHSEKAIFDNFDMSLMSRIDKIIIEIHDKKDRNYLIPLIEKTHKLVNTERKNFTFERIVEEEIIENTTEEIKEDKKLIKKSSRSKTYLVNRDDQEFIRKEYKTSSEFIAKCGMANNLFGEFPWMTTWENNGVDWFEIKKYNIEDRLDKKKNKLDYSKRLSIATDILYAILDMYIFGYSHRDIHDKNVFLIDGQIKIIDFEYLEPLHDPKPNFFDSYDITGKGMDSPANSQNMCLKKEHPNAILESLGISFEDVKKELIKKINSRLVDISKKFDSKNGEHTRSVGMCYSSFEVGDSKLDAFLCQRDTQKRLDNFRIEEKDIKDKSILDIDTNIGSVIFNLLPFKPSYCLGIDSNKNLIHSAKQLVALNEIGNVEFKNYNVDEMEISNRDIYYTSQHEIKRIDSYDVVFALSINKHVKKEKELYDLLGVITAETLYFEANEGTNKEDIFDNLYRVGFKTIIYMGESNDDIKKSNNVRKLFIAKK